MRIVNIIDIFFQMNKSINQYFMQFLTVILLKKQL